eukprot:1958554-Rhodomonas_salina.1
MEEADRFLVLHHVCILGRTGNRARSVSAGHARDLSSEAPDRGERIEVKGQGHGPRARSRGGYVMRMHPVDAGVKRPALAQLAGKHTHAKRAQAQSGADLKGTSQLCFTCRSATAFVSGVIGSYVNAGISQAI